MSVRWCVGVRDKLASARVAFRLSGARAQVKSGVVVRVASVTPLLAADTARARALVNARVLFCAAAQDC